MSPDQKGIETTRRRDAPRLPRGFTMSPDQKGIETPEVRVVGNDAVFTMSPDQKGIETRTRKLRFGTHESSQ